MIAATAVATQLSTIIQYNTIQYSVQWWPEGGGWLTQSAVQLFAQMNPVIHVYDGVQEQLGLGALLRHTSTVSWEEPGKETSPLALSPELSSCFLTFSAFKP